MGIASFFFATLGLGRSSCETDSDGAGGKGHARIIEGHIFGEEKHFSMDTGWDGPSTFFRTKRAW